jgi:hypothetical protein
MKKCNPLIFLSKKEICVPFGKKIKQNTKKIYISNKLTGSVQKILKIHSGASKEKVYMIKKGNKEYISYVEDYKIPKGKSLKFIDKSDLSMYSFYGKEKKNIHDILKELELSDKVSSKFVHLTAKVIASVIFLINNEKLRVQIIMDSAYNNGFEQLGKYVDTNKTSVSFKLVNVTNPPDKELLHYMKEVSKLKKTKVGYKKSKINYEFYAKFLNPQFIHINLKKWFKKVQHFFDPFFKDIHKLHKLDIFHHDLHFENIWKRGKNFKFIDFGRSSSFAETCDISYPINKYKSDIWKIQHTEKRKLSMEFKKSKNKRNILECMMLAELNYPDSLKFKGIRQDYEFCRHDIDEAVILDSFGKDHDFEKFGMSSLRQQHLFYYKNILLTFKKFIASRYADANN